ncbi:hypothetical protein [Ectobacillus panaciterrae]|uniref:hypothetical protein n=1 Tax=Ectobacillus panaciterrae TaxID=363872 RepID=UPI0003FA07AC|nr:hypothetical protein [Ectobacillus panaciterrae]
MSRISVNIEEAKALEKKIAMLIAALQEMERQINSAEDLLVHWKGNAAKEFENRIHDVKQDTIRHIQELQNNLKMYTTAYTRLMETDCNFNFTLNR